MLKRNSYIKHLLLIPFLTIPVLFLLLHVPPSHLCLMLQSPLKLLVLLSQILITPLRRCIIKMAPLLWFLKLMLLSLHPAWANCFDFVFKLQHFLPARFVQTLSLFRESETSLKNLSIILLF